MQLTGVTFYSVVKAVKAVKVRDVLIKHGHPPLFIYRYGVNSSVLVIDGHTTYV